MCYGIRYRDRLTFMLLSGCKGLIVTKPGAKSQCNQTGLVIIFLVYRAALVFGQPGLPPNTIRRSSAGAMLVHRLRQWPNITPAHWGEEYAAGQTGISLHRGHREQ